MKEKEIIETYHKRNNNGFEFADTEEFSEVAEYFNASKKYIEQLEDKLGRAIGHINATCGADGMSEDEVRYLKKIIGGNDSK